MFSRVEVCWAVPYGGFFVFDDVSIDPVSAMLAPIGC